MNKAKDTIAIILATGLIALLGVIVVGDFYIAFKEMRPVDESVIDLLSMAITGVVGIIAGYLAGKPSAT